MSIFAKTKPALAFALLLALASSVLVSPALADLASDKESAVTTGGTEKKPHGIAEFVAQEEMDRFSGYWWSPDGKSIGFRARGWVGLLLSFLNLTGARRARWLGAENPLQCGAE